MANGKKDRTMTEWEITNKKVQYDYLHRPKYHTSYDNGDMQAVRDKIKNIKISNE